MAKKGIPAETIIAMLEAKAGFVSHAAAGLGITYQGLHKRILGNKKIARALEAILEKKLDFAESKLMQQIQEGNLGAICFFLKCKGKDRGYIERQEHTGKDGKPIEAVISFLDLVKRANGSGGGNGGAEVPG